MIVVHDKLLLVHAHSFSFLFLQAVQLAGGKMLGGSSSLNIMVYMRGNPNDFNLWSNLTGNPDWSYENVLPYFKKSENYEGNYPDREWI